MFPLYATTSKLGIGTLFDYPNEEPGACAELSLIKLNLGVHLAIVPIRFPETRRYANFDFVEIDKLECGPHNTPTQHG